jgi:hypothetical protein
MTTTYFDNEKVARLDKLYDELEKVRSLLNPADGTGRETRNVMYLMAHIKLRRAKLIYNELEAGAKNVLEGYGIQDIET